MPILATIDFPSGRAVIIKDFGIPAEVQSWYISEQTLDAPKDASELNFQMFFFDPSRLVQRIVTEPYPFIELHAELKSATKAQTILMHICMCMDPDVTLNTRKELMAQIEPDLIQNESIVRSILEIMLSDTCPLNRKYRLEDLPDEGKLGEIKSWLKFKWRPTQQHS